MLLRFFSAVVPSHANDEWPTASGPNGGINIFPLTPVILVGAQAGVPSEVDAGRLFSWWMATIR